MSIKFRLNEIENQIRLAQEHFAKKTGPVQLLAVSKTFPIEKIRQAYDAGQRAFGENYLQEALDKIQLLQDLNIEWHFIGPIQSNKTKAIAEHFAWVHTVCRYKEAKRLSQQRPPHLPPLNILLQVNIDEQESKSGIAPGDVSQLAEQVIQLPNIKLRGLMAIPAKYTDYDEQQKPFRAMYELQEKLIQQGMQLDTLSMGMSSDFKAAIAQGATLIRIGTAIFGAREQSR